MNELKILQVYDYMQLGGAETHIITLSKALLDMGHKVKIVSSDGPAVAKLNELGLDFIELDMFNPVKYFFNAEKLIEIIQKEKIDIVHCHPFHSQIVCSLVRSIIEIPIVTTIHGPYMTPAVKGLYDFFDRFILISEEARSYHVNKKLIQKEEIMEVIPNCVPIPSLTHKSTSEVEGSLLTVTYVSRLDDDKFSSIKFFIYGIEESARYLDINAIIIGQGTRYSEIRQMTNNINQRLNKKIFTIINGSTDVLAHMENADVIVGVGRVLLEALSLNKIPICIGNTGYVGILTRDNLMSIAKVNFTDRNSPQKLSINLFVEDLKRIKTDKEAVLKNIARTLNAFRENFDIKNSVIKHFCLYLEVIKEAKKTNKQLDINSLFNSKYNLHEIEIFEKAIKLKDSGYNYELENTKQITILLKPDFYDREDKWRIKLVNLLLDNKLIKNTTIVIRICNDFHNNLNDILELIECTIKPYENHNIDILIDCEYQDGVSEVLMLSNIHYFIPTNAYQQRTIFTCRLLNVQII